MTESEERLERLQFRARNVAPEVAVWEARAYFASLAPGDARELAERYPDHVGSLDGVPVELRYYANRLRIDAERNRLTALPKPSKDERKRLATLNEMLTPTRSLGVDPATGKRVVVEQYRQFLSVDPTRDGCAVEVLGDLDNARQVAVLVPGMGNDLETLRSQADRAHTLKVEAGPGTAAVLWMDYDSPDGVLEAASKQDAWDAISGFRRFQAGLDTELLPEASTTVIGHSYGTTVVGQALLRGARFDRVVLTGSPGISREVTSAAELVPPGIQVFAARAPGDYVSYTQWHGPDPASFPDVVRLQTGAGVRWHDQYYRPNSEALRNLGRVIRGDLAAVTTADTSPSQETRLLPGVSWAGAIRGAAEPVSAVYDGVAAMRGVKPPAIASSAGTSAGPSELGESARVIRPDDSRWGRAPRPEGPTR
ncbi:alpha/beta hydrolase family protein [Kribbella sp. NBC_01245]|uniref:alpha/beta hydrolase n=1 Tax=Kribbella sp. NBC_01245 TaxID=2903578 RepID=UPI002E2DA31A|nr:alpha/beta hydrolase [Kribbella sp. NBC_01245]